MSGITPIDDTPFDDTPFDDRPPEAVHAAARLEMYVYALREMGYDWIDWIKQHNAQMMFRKPKPGQERAFEVYDEMVRKLMRKAMDPNAA